MNYNKSRYLKKYSYSNIGNYKFKASFPFHNIFIIQRNFLFFWSPRSVNLTSRILL